MSYPSDAQVLDECRIRSLLLSERYYRDTCQFEKERECFHPDASKTWIDVAWYKGDIDGFLEGSKKISGHNITVIHLLEPVNITINASKAISESYCQLTSRFKLDGVEYDKLSYTRLFSKLEKIETSRGLEWKILTVDPIYIRDNIVACAPQKPETIPSFDGVETFPRDGYKFLAWRLAHMGVVAREDMADESDADSVKNILDSYNKWVD